MNRFVSSVVLVLLAACRGAPPQVDVETFGTMREVLREGHTQERVGLGGFAREGTIGVGALTELAGEVTITNGRVLVSKPGTVNFEEVGGDTNATATLMAVAEVRRWIASELPDCETIAQLEVAIGDVLATRGFALAAPTPVRIIGRAPRLAFHAIAGACPLANPDGPPPVRFSGAADEVELVGFYVTESAGVLTHHARRTHLHVVTPDAMGHLDGLKLVDATLFVPR